MFCFDFFRGWQAAGQAADREVAKKMYRNKKSDSKGSKKRKHEDEYDLQTILDEDTSTDVAEPKAAARNAEKNDEAVREFHNVFKFM